jgi:hypothetical protein
MHQRADDGSAAELMDLNVVAKTFLAIQKAKLAYEAASDRLRLAEDDRAQRRSEATQRSNTLATWTMVLVSVVISIGTIVQAFKH